VGDVIGVLGTYSLSGQNPTALCAALLEKWGFCPDAVYQERYTLTGYGFWFYRSMKIRKTFTPVRPLIKLTFTAEDLEQLHYERFHHPHPRVQRKMKALYLKSQGYPHWEMYSGYCWWLSPLSISGYGCFGFVSMKRPGGRRIYHQRFRFKTRLGVPLSSH